MKKFSIVLLIVIFSLPVLGQQDPNYPNNPKEDGDLSPRFAALTKEASVVCGIFLPNQIPNMTEIISLCGGRFGFKIGQKTILEPQLLAGAGHAQSYMLGSLSFRGDFQTDDIIGSVYMGGDIHYATTPVLTGTVATDSSTNIYFGAHLGGAIWFELADNLYFRTDMQFLVNPGTALFIGFSLVLRFAPSGNDPANLNPQ